MKVSQALPQNRYCQQDSDHRVHGSRSGYDGRVPSAPVGPSKRGVPNPGKDPIPDSEKYSLWIFFELESTGSQKHDRHR